MENNNSNNPPRLPSFSELINSLELNAQALGASGQNMDRNNFGRLNPSRPTNAFDLSSYSTQYPTPMPPNNPFNFQNFPQNYSLVNTGSNPELNVHQNYVRKRKSEGATSLFPVAASINPNPVIHWKKKAAQMQTSPTITATNPYNNYSFGAPSSDPHPPVIQQQHHPTHTTNPPRKRSLSNMVEEEEDDMIQETPSPTVTQLHGPHSQPESEVAQFHTSSAAAASSNTPVISQQISPLNISNGIQTSGSSSSNILMSKKSMMFLSQGILEATENRVMGGKDNTRPIPRHVLDIDLAKLKIEIIKAMKLSSTLGLSPNSQTSIMQATSLTPAVNLLPANTSKSSNFPEEETQQSSGSQDENSSNSHMNVTDQSGSRKSSFDSTSGANSRKSSFDATNLGLNSRKSSFDAAVGSNSRKSSFDAAAIAAQTGEGPHMIANSGGSRKSSLDYNYTFPQKSGSVNTAAALEMVSLTETDIKDFSHSLKDFKLQVNVSCWGFDKKEKRQEAKLADLFKTIVSFEDELVNMDVFQIYANSINTEQSSGGDGSPKPNIASQAVHKMINLVFDDIIVKHSSHTNGRRLFIRFQVQETLTPQRFCLDTVDCAPFETITRRGIEKQAKKRRISDPMVNLSLPGPVVANLKNFEAAEGNTTPTTTITNTTTATTTAATTSTAAPIQRRQAKMSPQNQQQQPPQY